MPFAKQTNYKDGVWQENRGSNGLPKATVPRPQPVKIPYPNKGK